MEETKSTVGETAIKEPDFDYQKNNLSVPPNRRKFEILRMAVEFKERPFFLLAFILSGFFIGLPLGLLIGFIVWGVF